MISGVISKENIKFIDTEIYPYVFKDGLDVFHIDARSQEIKNGKRLDRM